MTNSTNSTNPTSCPINPPNPIKASGNIRKPKDAEDLKLDFDYIKGDDNDKEIEEMEKEVIVINSIDDDTLNEIKVKAAQNPVTKELMDKAKQFFNTNRDKVAKQMRDLVALYNIKDEKPFFFISPSEARLAINYIKGVRNGFIQEEEDNKAKDGIVHDFINRYKEIKEEDYILIDSEYSKNDKLNYNTCYNKCFLKSNTSDLSMDWLNRAFAIIESHDYIVNVLIINARRYADIRNFGKMYYDAETNYKKIIEERGVVGKIWTADIYVSKEIPSDVIITGCVDNLKDIKRIFVKTVIDYKGQ